MKTTTVGPTVTPSINRSIRSHTHSVHVSYTLPGSWFSVVRHYLQGGCIEFTTFSRIVRRTRYFVQNSFLVRWESILTPKNRLLLVRWNFVSKIQRMFVRSARPPENVGRVLLFIACVLLLAGCPAPPKSGRVTSLGSPHSPSPYWTQSPGEAPPQTVTLPSDPAIFPARDLLAPVLPEESMQIPSGLIPLDAWAQLCGFSDLRVVSEANPYTVDLEGSSGVLTLTFGNRFAKWNGVNVGLSFTPGVKQGQLVVHSIDVVKNFYPLALGTLSVPKEVRILVLDPGHGGSDPGSLASGKTYEKDLALDWALRIEKLLDGSSWKVVLTRRDDRDIPLSERVAIADRNNADIFISLHFNSLEKSSGSDESGIETFCLTPVGAPSNVTRGYEDDTRRLFPNN